jgi:protease-4
MGKEQAVVHATSGSPNPRKGRALWWIGGAIVVLAVVWSVGLCALVGITSGRSGRAVAWGGDAVAVIYVEGTIGMSSPTTGAGVVGAEIIEYIRQAEKSRQVKAIVVYINSPGGTVVPSDEMYRALRDAEKPVVAAMGDVAASGGYYIACGADKILAHPATVTGSIGVYAQLINAADLLTRLGVEGIIVRSGDSKAVGNWFEHPTDEQLAIEQAIVDELNDMFVKAVSEGRSMGEEEVRQLADGRPYTGQQALDLGLIDALGNLSDAISMASELAGIEGEPQVIKYRRTPSLLETWLAGQQSQRGDAALLEWLKMQYVIPQMRYLAP